MSGWTAVVPIKPTIERKTRLRGHLDQQQRTILTDFMLGHVFGILARAPSVTDIAILAVDPPGDRSGRWLQDERRGLNGELQAFVRSVPQRLLVLHADLPALTVQDVEALIRAASEGIAIAPDRWSIGTNALAARDPTDLTFAFGDASLRRHVEISPRHRIVTSLGLGLDVDVWEDIEMAVEMGVLPGRIVSAMYLDPSMSDTEQKDAAPSACERWAAADRS